MSIQEEKYEFTPDDAEEWESESEFLEDWFSGCINCPQCYHDDTITVDRLVRLDKVTVWCSKCKLDLADYVRKTYGVPHTAPLISLPTFNVTDSKLSIVKDAATQLARAESSRPHTFRVGDELVSVGDDGHASVLTTQEVQVRLSEVARFKTARSYVDAPTTTVEAIRHASDDNSFPQLDRVITVPTFTADGELSAIPGYDEATKTYYAPVMPVIVVPGVNATDAAWARSIILTLFDDFPFVGDADRANAIACTLQPFVQPMINAPMPLYVFDAAAFGTGKTKCAETALGVGCGTLPLTGFGADSKEQRKSLLSLLKNLPAGIIFDNVTGLVRSEVLEAILTADSGVWEDRVLGGSTTARVPVWITWAMTTNNGRVGHSLARRCIWIRQDAKVEQPNLRTGPTPGSTWRYSLPTYAVTDTSESASKTSGRSALVTACLTMIQYWINQGMPAPEIPADAVRGSFERWQYVLGGILQANDITGFCENAAKYDARSDEHAEHAELLRNLQAVFSSGDFDARTAFEHEELRSGSESAQGLGMVFAHHRDEIAGGLVLRRRDERRTWHVETA